MEFWSLEISGCIFEEKRQFTQLEDRRVRRSRHDSVRIIDLIFLWLCHNSYHYRYFKLFILTVICSESPFTTPFHNFSGEDIRGDLTALCSCFMGSNKDEKANFFSGGGKQKDNNLSFGMFRLDIRKIFLIRPGENYWRMSPMDAMELHPPKLSSHDSSYLLT